MNGEYEIDEDTFRGMPVDKQNWIQYKTFNKYRTDTDCRLDKLEKRKRKDAAVSSASGLIGGFMAVVVSKILGLGS